MAGDAENEGGRRRDGDVQSGEWRELEGGGKYYLRGCGNGECRPLRLPIAGSCRIRDNPRRIRRSASSVPNFSSCSTNCDRTAETSREGRNSRQMCRTTIVKARIEMKLHSDTSPRDHAELSRPFHAEPPPSSQNRTSFIFYEDGCTFSPPRSVSSTAFCLSPKYKSGRNSAKMGGKTATTVATIVIIFIVSL